MENLEKFGVNELPLLELSIIDGGGKIKTIKTILEWLGVAEMAGDFYDGFNEGWNEVRN